jgi:uncharacterized protein YfiM (DUF2279 family)
MLLAAARLAAGMGTARVRRISRNARAQGIAIGFLAFFAVIALVFFLAAVTVALAGWLGLLEALVVMSVAALLACLATVLVIRAQTRRREREKTIEAMQDRRLMETAAISLLPQLRGAGMLGLGVLAVGAFLLSRRREGPEDE